MFCLSVRFADQKKKGKTGTRVLLTNRSVFNIHQNTASVSAVMQRSRVKRSAPS